VEDHKPKDDSDNLGKKGGGEGERGTMALPQFELVVRVKKIKLYPLNGREERI
jgi:hypothetical protein